MRFAMDIRVLDNDNQWERWIVEEFCDLDYEDYYMDKIILTQKALEQNLDEIIRRIEKIKSQFDDPPLYSVHITCLEAIDIAYQILALLLLETGSYVPEVVKEKVLKSTEWEFDKQWDWDENALKIRKFYLNEFREKILHHEPGKKEKFVDLKVHSDKEFDEMCIGLTMLKEYIESGKIKDISHINLDCQNLTEIPNSVLKLTHIKKLSLDKNNIVALPQNIDDLVNLEHLSLLDNKIKELPPTFKNLKNLDDLTLYGNPVSSITPLENFPPIIAKRKKYTREWLSSP